ncbi:Putative uncharacterized transposon-derived protein F52C9.6 [Eumeta japonica]|uniref:Uncharacterized transposon-derived protein F52C9.6 n=1 Tax=Eumeta variegata TaxID=151549 RepID=A0A4C1T7L3_EUMVA|nr:Putative uncharacterized transposon-derived protein F52C9.6 [Eumeta japonica]
MWTWITDGITKNEIDFFMINKTSYFSNFNIINQFNLNTNHRLIRAELKTMQPSKPRPRQEPRNIKLGNHQREQLRYKELYAHNHTSLEETNSKETSDTPKFPQAEIERAIVTERKDKAPGPDGISNEILMQNTQVLDKYKTYQRQYYIAFIDYTKAFDSLYHENIWKSLKEQGIEQKYIRLIKNVYSHSTARIQLEKKGTPFRVRKGVRQGDPLSPKLFSTVLETIFRGLNWENLRINIDGASLTHLRFADDIVLFAETLKNIQQMIYELANESEKTGLKLNPEKTKVMTNGKKSTIRLGNNQIDYTDEYVYLGQLITQEDPICKDVERRIINSWKRYWSLKEIMKDKTLHINVNTKLFNTCVLPVLTYGSHTWALAQNTTRKLETCQYAMERNMLNVKRSDRIKNHTIRKKTNVIDITSKIRRLKWQWAGHMIRGEEKWSKIVTRWYPREGKRKRGRPENKWDDDIRQVAGVTWNRVTQDRREWKRLEEAFADWQTDLQKVIKY